MSEKPRYPAVPAGTNVVIRGKVSELLNLLKQAGHAEDTEKIPTLRAVKAALINAYTLLLARCQEAGLIEVTAVQTQKEPESTQEPTMATNTADPPTADQPAPTATLDADEIKRRWRGMVGAIVREGLSELIRPDNYEGELTQAASETWHRWISEHVDKTIAESGIEEAAKLAKEFSRKLNRVKKDQQALADNLPTWDEKLRMHRLVQRGKHLFGGGEGEGLAKYLNSELLDNGDELITSLITAEKASKLVDYARDTIWLPLLAELQAHCDRRAAEIKDERSSIKVKSGTTDEPKQSPSAIQTESKQGPSERKGGDKPQSSATQVAQARTRDAKTIADLMRDLKIEQEARRQVEESFNRLRQQKGVITEEQILRLDGEQTAGHKLVVIERFNQLAQEATNLQVELASHHDQSKFRLIPADRFAMIDTEGDISIDDFNAVSVERFQACSDLLDAAVERYNNLNLPEDGEYTIFRHTEVGFDHGLPVDHLALNDGRKFYLVGEELFGLIQELSISGGYTVVHHDTTSPDSTFTFGDIPFCSVKSRTDAVADAKHAKDVDFDRDQRSAWRWMLAVLALTAVISFFGGYVISTSSRSPATPVTAETQTQFEEATSQQPRSSVIDKLNTAFDRN